MRSVCSSLSPSVHRPALLSALALACGLAAPSQAGTMMQGPNVGECGSVLFDPRGARGAFEVRTRGVSCGLARKIARASKRHHGERYPARGFRCVPRQVGVGLGRFAYRCRRSASRVRFITLLGPQQSIVVEAEDGSGGGHTAFRPDASGPRGATVHLATGESLSMRLRVVELAPYELRVRYSNDNFGPDEVIDVGIDGQPLGQITAQNTGAWETFVFSEPLGPVGLRPGSHTVTLTVTGGDGYGWEVDAVRLALANRR
jgi:Carbohydrate binding module (family 6)